MKKAILMSRVSTDEQARGYSLDVQEETLKRYCENHDIEIVDIYREDHSAKNFNRPEFRRLLAYAKANSGKIDYLLFTSWDRFSRNTADAYEMMRKLNEIGIEPQAIEQPIDFSIPETKAMLAIYLELPEIDNDRRSIKIKSGIRGAWKAGRWTHHAPRGYKNSRDEQNKPLLVPNEEAKHVKYIFQEVSKGKLQADLRVELRSRGFEISKGGLSKLLRNPLYMGKVFVPAETGQLAYLADGVHESLISEKVFNKVQVVINIRIEKRKQPKVTRKREELPLRGYLICPNCGLNLTGSASRSRNKTRHFYYHCNHCGKVRVRANHLNSVFEKILGELKFKQEVQELYLEIIKQLFDSGEATRNQTIIELSKQIDQQDQRLQNIQNLLVDNKIGHEDYDKMKSRFEDIKKQFLLKLRQIKSVRSNFEKYLQSAINLLGNLEKYYHTADVEVKQQLIGSIFPEKLVFVDGKVRTTRINEVLRLILVNDKGYRNMKKGQLTSNLWLSSGVKALQYHMILEKCTTAEERSDLYERLENYYFLRGQVNKSTEYVDLKITELEKFAPTIVTLFTKFNALNKYIMVGKNDLAFQVVQTAEEQLGPPLDNNIPFGYLDIYLALEDVENAEKALKEAEAAILAMQGEINRKVILNAQGKIYKLKGEYELAIQSYLKQLELDPNDAAIHVQLGRSYRMRSDLKKAEDHIQKALAIHPFWPDANYELGLVYAERGKKDEALEYLKRAQIIWEDADPDYEPALKTREKMAELEASAM
jgi:DNA invertase Pin-like site-specific DNA recombinase/tetratricopeptide (TPR) repeat protein/predicted RNA-binding Zn-ribbon protein involved in translation (DUF1610 family)